MALTQSPSIVTNGLVMYYDMTNIQKSSRGAPTTNISTGMGIGTYLNTPSDVTSTLTQTGELYRGQPVYKQVLTPVTATGVGYLTNAGNPGIGVVTSGGGGAAARYTGHSIFFNPAVGRLGLNSSTPIYTHYSNIGGWQSTGNYDDMGDGWYRAHVIYYNASGGSDGKYWAINPAGATLGAPITVYWAAPFKEDRNDSSHVSPYVNDTRSNTQSILDLTGNNTVTATSLTYASDGTFSFNRTNNPTLTTSLPVTALPALSNFTLGTWLNITALPPVAANNGVIFGATYYAGTAIYWRSNGSTFTVNGFIRGNDAYRATASYTLPLNTVHYIVLTNNYSAGTLNLYVNGILFSSVATATQEYNPGLTPTAGNISINIPQVDGGGSEVYTYFTGIVYSAAIYNRALSAAEVQQNFNALRGRYGI